MTAKASQAFAAFRQSLIAELTQSINDELLPNWNSQCAHIRKLYEETLEVANQTPDEQAKQTLIKLAEKKRQAAIMNMAYMKRQFLDSLQVRLKLELSNRCNEYGGEFVEVEEENKYGKLRKVTKAQFPDGSRAHVPDYLWINYSGFDRA